MLRTPERGCEADTEMTYDEWREKRQYKRYPSDLKVKYQVVGDADGQVQEATILNISRGGVFVATKSPLAVGTEIKIQVTIVTPFGEEQELRAQAKVMWQNDRPEEEGMGLSFTEIDRHTQYAMLACAYRGEG